MLEIRLEDSLEVAAKHVAFTSFACNEGTEWNRGHAEALVGHGSRMETTLALDGEESEFALDDISPARKKERWSHLQMRSESDPMMSPVSLFIVTSQNVRIAYLRGEFRHLH